MSREGGDPLRFERWTKARYEWGGSRAAVRAASAAATSPGNSRGGGSLCKQSVIKRATQSAAPRGGGSSSSALPHYIEDEEDEITPEEHEMIDGKTIVNELVARTPFNGPFSYRFRQIRWT